MIVVTGATGQLGRAIVLQLLERIPASQIGASVRAPEEAADLEGLGVRVRRGDFGEPDTLPQAFEGATQLLMVSSNAAAQGGDTLGQHRAAISAAHAAGVKRVVYTSHMAASSTSAFPPMLHHAATEEMLRESGLAWTALRNGFYAQSGLLLMGDALQTGMLDAPADGKVSWTAHADLAEAAAILLAGEPRFEGPTPPLTAAVALDLADLAAIAAELLDRPVQRKVIEDQELRALLAARGAPDSVATIALGLYTASRKGEFSAVDGTLGELLGRRPIDMRTLLAKKVQPAG